MIESVYQKQGEPPLGLNQSFEQTFFSKREARASNRTNSIAFQSQNPEVLSAARYSESKGPYVPSQATTQRNFFAATTRLFSRENQSRNSGGGA
jgi:hypothetical protein